MRAIKISGLSALLLFVACAPGYTSGQYYPQTGFGDEISSHSHTGNGGNSASSSHSDGLYGYPNLETQAMGNNADAYASVYPNNGYNEQPGYNLENNGYNQGNNQYYQTNDGYNPGNNENYPDLNVYQ